ncbi:MAG: flagellar hook-length control protein FliK [Pyrinomonadaceae bacterium]|nr:flagellar hook-length control protein FliK [Pyrinomonadaceae bacterium]
MMQIGKLDTFVRGGPAMPDDVFPAEEDGQFDSLLSALVPMPFAQNGESMVPVDGETDTSMSALGSERRFAPHDLPAFEGPGMLEDAEALPEMPDVLNDGIEPELPPVPDADAMIGPKIEPGDTPPTRMDTIPGSKINEMRAQRNQSPVLSTIDTVDIIPGEKKGTPVVDTPPILLNPVDAPEPQILTPATRIQGVPINELAKLRSSTVESKTSEVVESIEQIDSETVTTDLDLDSTGTETHTGAGFGSGENDKVPENLKVSDAIFERFAVEAENTVKDSKLESPIDAEVMVDQIEKPILEVISTDLEDGEPALLKIRLKPAELGTIDIRLEKNASGNLDIEIAAESEMAVKILNESFEQLRESLKDSGWQVQDLNIFNRLSSEHSHRDSDRDPTQGQSESGSADSSDSDGDASKGRLDDDDSAERLVSIRA